jgi:hypothetical protein
MESLAVPASFNKKFGVKTKNNLHQIEILRKRPGPT